MRLVLPRLILGNRGDLASRWGVVLALHQLGVRDVTVFSQFSKDVPPVGYHCLPYGRFLNSLHSRAGWRALRRADTALWAVGLDIQDDSSLVKLLYLWVMFRLYRLIGLRIWCLFQGAGPLETPIGKRIATGVLEPVDLFAARDPGTFRLIGECKPNMRSILAHDAIFLPGFEDSFTQLDASTQVWLCQLFDVGDHPVIGFNIRQWYHFASDFLPFELMRERYLERSLPKMAELLDAAKELIARLRIEQKARVILISAYQLGVVPWEDDISWLTQIKNHFPTDNEVILVDRPVTLPAYFTLMSRLTLMIGMRLHSALIALRFGVPSINLNYTLKGRDIMTHLGLPENVLDLEQFVADPTSVYRRAQELLGDQAREKERTHAVADRAVQQNLDVLKSLIDGKKTS